MISGLSDRQILPNKSYRLFTPPMTAASSIAPRRQLVARATALLFSVAAFSLVVVTWRSHGVVSGLLQDRISSDLAAHVIAIAGNVDAVITARLNDVQVAALNPAVVAVVAVVAVAAGDERPCPTPGSRSRHCVSRIPHNSSASPSPTDPAGSRSRSVRRFRRCSTPCRRMCYHRSSPTPTPCG